MNKFFFCRDVHSVELKSKEPSRLWWMLLIHASNTIEIQPTAGNKTLTTTTQRYSRIISYLQATTMLNPYTHKQSFPLTNTLMNANQLCASHEWFYIFGFSFILNFVFALKISSQTKRQHTKPFTIVIVYLHHIPEKSITFKV